MVTHSFHWTGRETLAGLAVIVVLLCWVRLRPRPVRECHGSSVGPALAVIAAALGCVFAYLRSRPARAATHNPPAPKPRPAPTVTHTTIVQHAASHHPLLSGWEIVAICITGLIVMMVVMLNQRPGE